MDNELLCRIGIISALVMYTGVLLLSAALYVLLEKVNRHLALLAMLLRSGEAIVGVAMVLKVSDAEVYFYQVDCKLNEFK